MEEGEKVEVRRASEDEEAEGHASENEETVGRASEDEGAASALRKRLVASRIEAEERPS